jgi:hypothetical protein
MRSVTILNNSFEDQGAGIQPGLAADWTVSSVSTGEVFAEFVNLIIDTDERTSGHETFEGEWPLGNSSGLVQGFTGYYSDLEPAGFAFLGVPRASDVEDFEGEWGSGRGFYVFEQIPSLWFSFDSFESEAEDVEDLEDGWPAGNTWSPSWNWVPEESAQFGSNSYDGFESGWYSGWNPSFSGGELSGMSFGAGYLVTGDDEGFEALQEDQPVSVVDPGADTFYSANHGLSNLWNISFRTDGRMPNGTYPETKYFVRNKTTHTFQVSAQSSSSIVDIVDAGYDKIWIVWDKDWYWTGEELAT